MLDYKISSAGNQDLDSIKSLLQSVGLPTEGIESHISHFHKVIQNKKLIAVVGLEIYEDIGLIRSLAVNIEYQKKGIGSILIHKIENYSTQNKLNTLYLFTDTADKLFVKLGYQYISINEIDSKLKKSKEFTICSSSTVMKKVLH